MSPDSHPDRTSSPRGPAILLALSLILFLSWQLLAGIRQYQSFSEIWAQQEATARQSVEAERNFRAMMIEFIELSEINDEVQRIIRKYNIKFNPNETPSPDSAPAPDSEDEPAVPDP